MSVTRSSSLKCFFAGIVLAVGLLPDHPAAAQRFIAVTNALTATQQAARVYVQSVDLQAGALPGPFALPGATTLGAPVAAPDGAHWLLATGWPVSSMETPFDAAPVFINVLRLTPFAVLRECRSVAEAGWREWPQAGLQLPSGEAMVILGESRGESGQWTGKLEVRPWNREQAVMESARVRWNLPGRPIAGLQPDPAVPRFVVLCQTATGGAPLLTSGNLETGDLDESIEITSSSVRLNTLAAGMIQVSNGEYLLVMLSGYEAGETSRDMVSWVHQVRAATLEPVGDPVAIPGEAAGRTPLMSATAGAWALTRLSGTQFGYAARILCDEQGPRKEEQQILAGVQHYCSLTAAPGASTVAASRDHRLEIWPEGARGDIGLDFAGVIRPLGWSGQLLLAGEGGQLRAIDSNTLETTHTVPLQTGRIEMILPVPAIPEGDIDGDGLTPADEAQRGADPANPDTDGDGLHDGIDAAPLAVSPALTLPDWIELNGDAAGRELKALPVAFGAFPDLTWRVQYAREAMPWLVIHPRSGRGEGVCYLGLDPAVYRAGPGVGGVLAVELQDPNGGVVAAAKLVVRIAAPRGPLRRILWLSESGDDDAEPRLAALRASLAAAPNYFSHTLRRGPLDGSLAPYSVVVLTAGAAIEGAVTRQTVLDYVADGGALLFVGDTPEVPDTPAAPQEEAPAEMPQDAPQAVNTALYAWLAPLDVHVLSDSPANGAQRTVAPGELTRHWQDFRFERGELFEAPASAVLVSEGAPGTGVFVAREYGYGRAALLASAEPFEEDQFQASGARLFAGALFDWLARANHERYDMDGDLLPDDMEDVNNNGNWDAGETSHLHADTDQDGLPDGLEDRNRNGLTEESETDPRNLDSDSDGIFDGADSMPLPPMGAPRVLAVAPGAAPAEGNQAVLIMGRNLTPQSTFWFGERPAEWARLFNSGHAEVWLPDAGSDAGGVVNVRVVSPDGQEAQLVNGFTYTPRGSLRLATQSSVTTDNAVSRGVLRLELGPGDTGAAPPSVGRMFLSIWAGEDVPVTWGAPRNVSSNRGVRPQVRASKPGVLTIELRSPRNGTIPLGILLEVPWEIAWTSGKTSAMLEIQNVVALTPHNGVLAVRKESLQVTPGTAAPPTPVRAAE